MDLDTAFKTSIDNSIKDQKDFKNENADDFLLSYAAGDSPMALKDYMLGTAKAFIKYYTFRIKEYRSELKNDNLSPSDAKVNKTGIPLCQKLIKSLSKDDKDLTYYEDNKFGNLKRLTGDIFKGSEDGTLIPLDMFSSNN